MLRGTLLLALLLGTGLAQAPKPLLVGGVAGEALYPGGAGVAYGEAGLVAEGLGLGLWQGKNEVALSLGALVKRFPVADQEARAARTSSAWRKEGKVYLPLRPLAQALGLSYVAGQGIRLEIPPARLLFAQGTELEGRRRLVLRFSREVNALPYQGGLLFPFAEGSGEGFRPEDRGLFLALDAPPDRLSYPGGGQVVLEWGPLPLPRPVVLLDPGHGGKDTGVGEEKTLVLDLARRVASRLSGVEVRLTRRDDRDVPLEERRRLAQGAAVVLSLHAKRGPGVTLYLADRPPTRLAQSVRELLPNLSPERKALLLRQAGDGEALAQALAQALAALGLPVSQARGPYALARVTGAGVVVEVGLETLASGEMRQALAEALAAAIRGYLP
ncbi:N-acetylmuramoyl-L-alanine amidase family protein [Thermus filiformis]|uniref:N-acetylmuramoyl-L-alanine amidase family protein n=1 Tax=Thermus filiformis TaxID=276 RepID=UPI000530EEBF|nr:N-acetylmuramoyl-L-alanine amidase [Thermus filiformis]